MAKYTGYVGRSDTGRGYAYSREQGIEPVEFRPSISPAPGAPEGDFVRALSGKYITDFAKPSVRGDYLQEQGRAFDLPAAMTRQPTPPGQADDRLDEEYNTAQMVINNEYLEKSNALSALPPESRQYMVMMGRLEAVNIQQLTKLDAEYNTSKKKFQELNYDNTIDPSQTEFAKNTYMNRSPIFKFKSPTEDELPPEPPSDIELATQAVKAGRYLKDAPRDSPVALAIEQQGDEASYELTRRRRDKGEDVFYVNIPAAKRKGKNSKVSGEFTAEEAAKKYTERGMEVPQEIQSYDIGKPTPESLRKANTKESYDMGVQLGYWE